MTTTPDPQSRHLTPAEAELVADALRALGYTVTRPPAQDAPIWLREDPDGFRIVDRD